MFIFAIMYKTLTRLLPIIVMIFVMTGTLLAPREGDDACYAFVQGADLSWNDHPATMQRVSTLADVARSQWLHYFDTNGRAPVHFLVQTFIGVLSPVVFAVANGLVFALVVVLLCRCQTPASRRGPLLYLVNLVAMFWLFPSKVTNMSMWASPSLSMNYLWVMLMVLVFLSLFRRCRGTDVPHVTLCVLVGFFTGWSNEAFAVPLGATVFMMWLRRRFRFRNAAEGALCVSLWAGTLPLVFSPATIHRAASVNGSASLYDFVCGTIDCFTAITVFYLFLALVAVCLVVRRSALVVLVRANAFMCVFWLIDLAFVSVAHSYPHSMCLLEFLSLILAVRLADVLRPGLFAGHPVLTACATAIFVVLAVWATAISVQVHRDTVDMDRRLTTNPDACTYFVERPICPLVRPLTVAPITSLTPASYSGSSMILLHTGRRDSLPMIVSHDDYSRLYDPAFFGPEHLLSGTAHAYEGRDFYYILCDSLTDEGAGVSSVTISYPARDLSLRAPWKHLFYYVRGNGPYTVTEPVDTFTAAGRRLLIINKRHSDPNPTITL